MDEKKKAFNTVDEYIASFPDDIQSILASIRETVKSSAPDAEEKIAYGMPAYKLKGSLVYFGAWKNHIGFYPATFSAIEAFAQELSDYEVVKGTIKFPFDQAIPHELIAKIVAFRVAENLKKAESKSKKRS